MEGYLYFALLFALFLGVFFGVATLALWKEDAKHAHFPITVICLKQFSQILLLIALVAVPAYPVDLWIIIIVVSMVAMMVLRRIGTLQLRGLEVPTSAGPGRTFAMVTIAVFGLGLILRVFVIDCALMPDDNMGPTLERRSVLWVQKNAYGMTLPFTEYQILPGRAPQRGDVVAFTQHLHSSGVELVARIVGLPGEQVRLFPSAVAIDGWRVPQQVVAPDEFEEDLGGVRHRVRILPDEPGSPPPWVYQDITLEPDHYLLLGDERSIKMGRLKLWTVTQEDFIGQVRASDWGQAVH